VFLDAVNPEDYRAVVEKLVEAAKCGCEWAIQELNDRILGRPLPGASATVIDEELSARVLASLSEEDLDKLEAAAKLLEPPPRDPDAENREEH
jgi:hypothetical protein